MRVRLFVVVGVLAACLLSTSALAYKTGITGYSGKQPSIICSSCHSGGAAPTVAITVPSVSVRGNERREVLLKPDNAYSCAIGLFYASLAKKFLR